MLAELAAANAAFSVIKTALINGRELTAVGKQIGDFVTAKKSSNAKANKKKRKGVGGY